MRRFAATFAVLSFLLTATVSWAGEGKVCKVLPQLVDIKGRQSLSPSLYERDAFQFYLRKHPKQVSGLCVEVQWKAKGVDWSKTKLRAELRGLLTNNLQTITREVPLTKSSFFGNWAKIHLTGDDYTRFGDLVAWRVTLWEGDRQLSELQSFLWNGVPLQTTAQK